MTKRMSTPLTGLLALGMAGCATVAAPPSKAPNEGSASYRMLDDSHMEHYQLAIGDIATGATPFQRILPVYPPSQLAACAPMQEVDAQVIVDETGKVSDVRGVLAENGSAMPPWSPFLAAVRTAVLQWRFNPLRINHWAADADGNTHEVDSTTKPFSLMYAFRFECHAGKATVTSAPTKG
ncbi:energy transducer TonB [Rhodanobacter hydrolyticus]